MFSRYFNAYIRLACGLIFLCAENFRQKFYLKQVLLMLNYQMNTQSVETCLGQSYPKNNIRDGGSTPLYAAYTVYRAQTVTYITLLPAVHFLEQAFAGADFSTEKFSAALSLISAALFQCPKIAKFSVAHFFKLSCDLRCSFSIAKSRKILRCSSSDI